MSPSSVKKSLYLFRKNELIKEKNIGNLRIISANLDKVLSRQIKMVLNMDKLSGLVENLLPASSIVLYGSFAQGINDEKSDINICIICNSKKKEIHQWKNHQLQLVVMTPVQWTEAKLNNKAYTSEVMKGLVLYGEMPG